MKDEELIDRYKTAKYILDISYKQLERYDGKTNQLLSLIGIDFTVLGIFTAFLFANIEKVTPLVKIVFLLLVPIDLILVIISLYVVKSTLSPHLKPVDHSEKAKNGLIFFEDINTAFSKEEYVDTLIGSKKLKDSKRYDDADPDAFYKCVIEDCAYDIYEQAQILKVKSTNIKKSYTFVFCATILTFFIVVLISVLSLV